mgnify:CR=1 FL=1
MPFAAEIFTASVVAVGNFNPAIFSPDWLERNKLIGEGDSASAREGSAGKALLVSPQVTNFDTEWFALQVVDTQFSLASKGVLSPAFKDLSSGIFQLLRHTPISAVGLNFSGHFKLADVDQYHKVGDVLAPKDIWDGLFPGDSTGLEQLTIRFQRGPRDKPSSKDDRRITIQPSRRVKYGVSLSINNHYDVSVGVSTEPTSAERVAELVDGQWELAWKDAVTVFDQLLSQAIAK